MSLQHVNETVTLEVSFKYLLGRKTVLFKKKGTKKSNYYRPIVNSKAIKIPLSFYSFAFCSNQQFLEESLFYTIVKNASRFKLKNYCKFVLFLYIYLQIYSWFLVSLDHLPWCCVTAITAEQMLPTCKLANTWPSHMELNCLPRSLHVCKQFLVHTKNIPVCSLREW